MEEKQCPSCNQVKDVSEFDQDSSRKNGLRPYCKECYRQYQEGYYKVHREKLLPKHNITATRSYYKRKIQSLRSSYEKVSDNLC